MIFFLRFLKRFEVKEDESYENREQDHLAIKKWGKNSQNNFGVP